MEFTKASRKAAPMLISVAGVSGAGKTYSALLLAAGLAGPNGKIGFIDTENGRGAMYADSPGIVKALPNGYQIMQFDPPFSPARYVEAIKAAEQAGVTVLCLDSTSHEWEGTGGCCDISETKKLRGMPNWSLAKMEHKKFLNHCLSSPMHIIFCLRAREKVKILEVNGKTEVVPIGISAISEKGFPFEMVVSLMLDEATHFAKPTKVPEPLAHLFTGAKLLTKEDGERIRQWNETGNAMDPHEQVKKRARAAADDGVAAYTEFYKALPNAQKKVLADSIHGELKGIAETADKKRAAGSEEGFSLTGPGDLKKWEELPRPPSVAGYKPGDRAYFDNNVYTVTDSEGWEMVTQ